jgi:hypothetical protein
MRNDLEVTITVRDRKGGRVFQRKKAGLHKTLVDLNALVEEKYEQKGDVPPIMGEIPPGW